MTWRRYHKTLLTRSGESEPDAKAHRPENSLLLASVIDCSGGHDHFPTLPLSRASARRARATEEILIHTMTRSLPLVRRPAVPTDPDDLLESQ